LLNSFKRKACQPLKPVILPLFPVNFSGKRHGAIWRRQIIFLTGNSLTTEAAGQILLRRKKFSVWLVRRLADGLLRHIEHEFTHHFPAHYLSCHHHAAHGGHRLDCADVLAAH
jgi:hypothetical protein